MAECELMRRRAASPQCDWRAAFIWAVGPDTGSSSQAIMCAATGVSRGRGLRDDDAHPLDPSDLGRCLRLIEMLPWTWRGVEVLAGRNPVWKALHENWARLAKTFIEEVGLNWEKADRAPKTFALMQKLMDGSRRD